MGCKKEVFDVRVDIQRCEDVDTNNNYPAMALVEYGAFAEMKFDNAAKSQTFMGIVSQGEAKEMITQDEEREVPGSREDAGEKVLISATEGSA